MRWPPSTKESRRKFLRQGDAASTTRGEDPQLQPKEQLECFRLTTVVAAGFSRLQAKDAHRFPFVLLPLVRAEDWPRSRKQSATAARRRPSWPQRWARLPSQYRQRFAR